MLKNYMLVAYRNFVKQPVYSAINILGLAIGVACSFLILLFVWNEISYDKYHPDSDRLYRITQTYINESGENDDAGTPFPMARALLLEYPDLIEESVRFINLQTESLSIANSETQEYVREEHFFFTDAGMFHLFDISLLRGNPETALTDPNTVVISESAADKYFKGEDPIGKNIRFEGRFNLTVTGVMQDWPKNSHFRADVLASFESLSNYWRNYDEITAGWRWNPNWTYVKLSPDTDPETLEELLVQFSEKYYTTDAIGENESVIIHLQPLTDIWLKSGLDSEIEPTSNILYVYLFSAIAILIIVIAAINFTNLSTARAIQRSREVGLRKTLGAEKRMLKFQFLSESILYTTISVLSGFVLAYLILPFFNQILGKSIEFSQFDPAWLALAVLLFIMITGVLSGLYPAFVLSSFNPVDSLRSATPNMGNMGLLRRGLVTFQFAITALLFIGTAVIFLQYDYIKDKNLGYDTEQIVILPTSNTWVLYDLDIYLDRLREHPLIERATGSRAIMGSEKYSMYLVKAEGQSDREKSVSKIIVTHDFLKTLGIQLVAGRDFSEQFSTDTDDALLVNKAAVDFFEWGSIEDAIGKYIDILDYRKRVVGVTEDFHYSYLKREIDPLIIELPTTLNSTLVNINYIKVQLNPGNHEPVIDYMRENWDDLDSAHPFEYFFYDDYMNTVYETEEQMSQIVSILSVLGIIIASMGLFGLASYSINKRSREIGIRKAMGATAPNIFLLLSGDYLKMILIANIIALPAGYFLADTWLQEFPYRIDLISIIPWVFLITLIALILISLISISSQSIRAAVMDPVNILKR